MTTPSAKPSPIDLLRADFEMAKQHFVLPFGGLKGFLDPFPPLIAELSPTYQGLGAAFLRNLESVLATMKLPGFLALNGVWMRYLSEYRNAGYIQAKTEEVQNKIKPDEVSARAEQIAREHWDAVKKVEEQEPFPNCYESMSLLMELRKNDDVRVSAAELLRQGLVLGWGSFEVLARDMFVQHVNANPALVLRLLSDSSTKRLFQAKGLDFEVLADFDFDVSEHMGDVLVRFHEVDNLAAIREVYRVLFPDDEPLRTALHRDELWQLSQRRHLIVHKRGVVDRKYISLTGDNLPVGEELALSVQDVLGGLTLVRDAGGELLRAVRDYQDVARGGEQAN